MSNARDVYAFFIEISMLPIHALSIRTCATMFPPWSATAMFTGWPISLAFFSAALITRRASSNFTAVIGSPFMCRQARSSLACSLFLRLSSAWYFSAGTCLRSSSIVSTPLTIVCYAAAPHRQTGRADRRADLLLAPVTVPGSRLSLQLVRLSLQLLLGGKALVRDWREQ